MLECLFVGLGGFIGSVARYLIGLIAVETASGFPVKTFAINLLGSFVLGIVSETALRDPAFSRNLVLLFTDRPLRRFYDILDVFQRSVEVAGKRSSYNSDCLYVRQCGAGPCSGVRWLACRASALKRGAGPFGFQRRGRRFCL